jgi:hypothetical protein
MAQKSMLLGATSISSKSRAGLNRRDFWGFEMLKQKMMARDLQNAEEIRGMVQGSGGKVTLDKD